MARTALFSKLRRLYLEAERTPNLEFSRSRRDFLADAVRLSALAATSTVLPLAQAATTATAAAKDSVLILGAGAAGLSAAYALQKAGVPFQILEGSSRLGGRIWTEAQFNESGQFIERGAELVDTNNRELISLARELDLEIEDFKIADRGLASSLYFFEGQLRTEKDLVTGLRPFAKAVRQALKEIFPSGKVQSIDYRKAVRMPGARLYDRLSLKEFLERQRKSVDSWILSLIEVSYVGEFGLEASEQSALNLLTLVDVDLADGFSVFGSSDESKRIKGGNSRLIEKLSQALSRTAPLESRVKLGARVVAIRSRGSSLLVSYTKDSQTLEISSRQVICALPFTLLREVEGLDSLGFSAVKLRAIREMGYGQNSKLMIDFAQRFWREKNRSNGSLTLDLPSQSFWETSRLQAGARGILTNFVGGRAGEKAGDQWSAQVLSDLEKVYLGSGPMAGRKMLINWNLMPFAKGSYACMRPGQWTTLWGSAGESELKGQILFAGEHTSGGSQGYMNGAVESGLRAAREGVQGQVGRRSAG